MVGWYDKLIAADPALNRLRFAGRATMTVGVTLGILVAIAHFTGQSFFAFLIGVVISMFASLAVADPEPKQQGVTTALIPIPSILAVTIASLLSFSTYIAEAVFVVVMFAAVYIRRFGPRWFAFGMVLFISYFFSMFLKAKPPQLPWMYLAIVIGAGVSFLFRFWILPDPSRPSVRLTLPAIRARLRLILAELRACILNPKKQNRHHVRMRRQVVYLNEIMLLDVGEKDSESWEDAFFAIELATQRLAELGREVPSIDERDVIVLDIDVLQSELRRRAPRESDEIDWCTLPDDLFGRALRQLLDTTAKAGPTQRDDDETQNDKHRNNEPTGNQAKGMLPTTRQAIQVAVASLIAIAGGELLSSKRWYWAAITAFIVYTGTKSRGDVFVKGWQRVAGTLLGVAAGIFIATVVHGNQIASFVLIFAGIFLGFYFIRVSYTIMIFWISILLALLYGLLGFFSIELLDLRLEETVIGATAGILVAVFILPTRTRTLAREQSQEFLRTLGSLIGDCVERWKDGGSNETILARVRELDRSFQGIRQAARPLTLRIPWMTEPRTSQHWLRVMLRLRYEAHTLAELARKSRKDPFDVPHDLQDAADHIRARIDGVAAAIETSSLKKQTLRLAQDATTDRTDPFNEDIVSAPGRCLKRIDWIITLLADDLGVTKESVVS